MEVDTLPCTSGHGGVVRPGREEGDGEGWVLGTPLSPRLCLRLPPQYRYVNATHVPCPVFICVSALVGTRPGSTGSTGQGSCFTSLVVWPGFSYEGLVEDC